MSQWRAAMNHRHERTTRALNTRAAVTGIVATSTLLLITVGCAAPKDHQSAGPDIAIVFTASGAEPRPALGERQIERLKQLGLRSQEADAATVAVAVGG